MKISTSHLTTVLLGIFTFIKYGESCDIKCDNGYRCVMRRSTCDYPPCPYFPTCVPLNDHHRNHRHHQQRHTENQLQRHPGHHRSHRHQSTVINALLSDRSIEPQEVEPTPSHPGRCPAPSGYGPCITTCRNDGDCQATEKCCGNGCGRTCTTANNGFKVKPGSCPRRVRIFHRDCRTACQHDNECPGIQKCCKSACGSTCSDPCFHWLVVNQRSSRLGSIWKLPFVCRS